MQQRHHILSCLFFGLWWPTSAFATFNLSCWQSPTELSEKRDPFAQESFPADHVVPGGSPEGKDILFNGFEAKRVSFVEGEHTKGEENRGIYRYTRDGQTRLIKMLRTSLNNTDQEWRAYLRGQTVGAPKILSAGTIRFDNGYTNPFVEMVEQFAGEKSITVKGSKWNTRFEYFAEGSPTVSQQIASTLARGWEQHYQIDDLDFIVSYGKAAVIDTAKWRHATKIDWEFVNAFNSLTGSMFRLSAKEGVLRQFHLDLVEAVAQRPGLTPSEKTSILAKIRFERGRFTEEEWVALISPLTGG